MFSKVNTAVNWGIEGQLVEIETVILRGLPNHIIVGLPSTIVKESKERVKAALKTTTTGFPDDRIIQNLYPADVKKEGTQMDLAIAMGIYNSLLPYAPMDLDAFGFLGELSLEGKIQPIQGILSLLDGLKKVGIKHAVIPMDNYLEASYLSDVVLYPYEGLAQLLMDYSRGLLIPAPMKESLEHKTRAYEVDFNELIGQEHAMRAAQIAIAGGHNLLIVGPPGCGKSMLAQRMQTIMPSMTLEEKIEITKIYGVSQGEAPNGLIHTRPFRAPHHTISRVGLVGGGSPIRPGEVSKAHKGILYLDEVGEFKSDVIDTLREPLSNKNVNITKNGRSLEMPSDFLLVATMNPCPCGNYLSKDLVCICSQKDIKRYFGRLSWPMLDRIDMTIYMNRVEDLDFHTRSGHSNLDSRSLFESVEEAREFSDNLQKSGVNSSELNETVHMLIKRIHNKEKLSMRSYHKLLNLSRTIANLDSSESIKREHVLEAMTYLTAIQVKRFFS